MLIKKAGALPFSPVQFGMQQSLRDDYELLNSAAYFVVKLNGEIAATIDLYPGKLTYVTEIDSFTRSPRQQIDTLFLEKEKMSFIIKRLAANNFVTTRLINH